MSLIIPERNISIVLAHCQDDFGFAERFRQVWMGLPEADRSAMLDHWSKPYILTSKTTITTILKQEEINELQHHPFVELTGERPSSNRGGVADLAGFRCEKA